MFRGPRKIIFQPRGGAVARPWSRLPESKRPACAGLSRKLLRHASVLCGDRATPAEAVVDTDLGGVLVVAETGADDIGRSGREGRIAEIVILVLGLGGPVRRKHVFEA